MENKNQEALEKGYGQIHVTSADVGILVASNAIIIDNNSINSSA